MKTNMVNTEIQVFDFKDNQVRTVTLNGETWFVGKDVCQALTLVNSRQALASLDDEKLTYTIYTSGQNREVMLINESGLYSVTLSSKNLKPRCLRSGLHLRYYQPLERRAAIPCRRNPVRS